VGVQRMARGRASDVDGPVMVFDELGRMVAGDQLFIETDDGLIDAV
jgi:hypothetical protein